MTSNEGLAGRHATVGHVVTEADLAETLGSGDVPVLATPRLVAWVEAATVAAVAEVLAPNTTTVGVRVVIDHLVASPLGARIMARAEVIDADARTIEYRVVAEHHPAGSQPVVIARGRVTRAIVDRQRFLDRLPG